MARIRTVKPEFWSSEQVMGLSRDARLLFIGLWNFCDDAGIHPASIPTIKALVLPCDDIALSSVAGFIEELVSADLLSVYEVAGKAYWQVTGWRRHQRIDQATFKYPKPDGNITQNQPRRRADSSNVQQVFAEHSTNVQQVFAPGKEGKGMDRSLLPVSNDTGCAQAQPDPVPPCPHDKILALYAEALPELTQPRTWTGQREVSLRARWRWVLTAKRPNGERYAVNEAEGLDYFRRFFAHVAKSDFLMGRKGQWSCDLEWLSKASNFAKVIDGKYDEVAA